MAIVESIFSVFTEVSDWFVTAIQSVLPIFWNSDTSSLTILGVLAVVSLGISVIFLLIGIVQRFLTFSA